MRRRNTPIPIVLAVFLMGAAAAAAREEKPIERFTAFAASLGTGKAGFVEIAIYRWSTDEERERLLTTLQEFGRDKLIDELQKIRPPVGYIRTPTSLAYDLYYARNHPAPDGGRRIVLATNRRVSFREAANNTRSMQYQFTLVELHIDKSGKGRRQNRSGREGHVGQGREEDRDRELQRLARGSPASHPEDALRGCPSPGPRPWNSVPASSSLRRTVTA